MGHHTDTSLDEKQAAIAWVCPEHLALKGSREVALIQALQQPATMFRLTWTPGHTAGADGNHQVHDAAGSASSPHIPSTDFQPLACAYWSYRAVAPSTLAALKPATSTGCPPGLRIGRNHSQEARRSFFFNKACASAACIHQTYPKIM